jgi:hypothetical protein
MSITSVQSPNAWYSSIIVNSGLWRVEMPSLRKMRPISNTRSMPPTMSRFRCSSSAMRRYISMSSACVVGDERAGVRAARLGVQHRRLDLDEAPSARVRRKLDTTAWRTSNARRASALTIRSA